ncbi:MAG TPA: hypothetical protein VF777_16155 [Phycisphaerales bacterium]
MIRSCVCVSASALVSISGSAWAGITIVNPGLYTNLSEVGQARIRLDQGNSQTWKAAFWKDLSMLANSGVQGPSPAVWSNAAEYDWTIKYNAASGNGSIQVSANQNVVTAANFGLSAGKSLAGFYFFVNSTYAGGSDINGAHAKTEVYGMSLKIDGGLPVAIPGLTADFLQSFVQGPNYYFDSAATDVEFSGKIKYTWNAGANLNNERNKFTLKLLEGERIPTPGATALLALGGLALARRRR